MRKLEIGIVYEDESLLIVHKPPGLATESASVVRPDMVSYLKNTKGLSYVGLCHRLDQPVEGLLAVAKTQKAAADISRQLQSGELEKRYLALAFDERSVFRDEFVLTDYLYKNPKTRMSEVVEQGFQGAGKAILKGRVLEHRQERILLCRIEIETGRFHQIRAQMSHAAMPLLGDLKYASPESGKMSKKLALRNVCLCADSLSLLHPVSKERLQFQIRVPWAE